MRAAWRKPSTSKPPSACMNFTRLSEARLHAESSRNMNSLQGLLARTRSVDKQVCQALIESSNWTPGSAQDHAAWLTAFKS